MEVGATIVENSTRLKYKVIHKSIDMITIVGNYANAIPQNLHITFVIENFEEVVCDA